jgi:hypothetical protein
MSIEIEAGTKDCTALTDAELAEMADLVAASTTGWGVGFLSKQREEWVLVTQAREGARLRGFALSTLERIGGTPCLLIGVASFNPGASAARALDEVLRDLYRRALLAFPDEDVLVGTRLAHPSGFRAFEGLQDVVPRAGHRATGEERAWTRRLGKRFAGDQVLDDRAARLEGDGNPSGLLDYVPRREPRQAQAFAEFFEGLDRERRDCVVAFGWAMAEDLAAGRLPR